MISDTYVDVFKKQAAFMSTSIEYKKKPADLNGSAGLVLFVSFRDVRRSLGRNIESDRLDYYRGYKK